MTETDPRYRPDPGYAPGDPPENRFRDPESAQAKFLEEVESLRPRLHRYCTRMLGSALDGEDVVQDTLAATFFRLDTVDRERPLGPLLFRIAHNRCIDLLRRRKFESDEEPVERRADLDLERSAIVDQQASRAMEHLLIRLAPRERSCFLLKEVLEHTLAETAEIVGCKTGAVKSALHRARKKLAELRDLDPGKHERPGDPADPIRVALLRRYAECFNDQDWEALASLVSEDVRLDVVGVLEDVGSEVLFDRYRGNYIALDGIWRLVPGLVDGEAVLFCVRQRPGEESESIGWPIRVEVVDGAIERIRDYVLQARLLENARVELL